MTTISGRVRSGEAVVPLEVTDGSGGRRRFQAVLDTGFTGYIALPPAEAAELGLAVEGGRTIILADGTQQTFQTYAASAPWLGEERSILVYGVGDRPLIGMRMLAGGRVTLDVIEDGPVAIASL